MSGRLITLIAIYLFIAGSCSPEHPDFLFKNGSSLVFREKGKIVVMQIRTKNDSLIATINPVRIEVFDQRNVSTYYCQYTGMYSTDHGVVAEAKLRVDNATLIIRDNWTAEFPNPVLHRKIEVQGNSTKAFLSAIEFEFVGQSRETADYFVPGMIYGGTGQISSNAIGGKDVYEKGNGRLWIREDRIPAPLMAIRFDESNSFSILNPDPDGMSSIEDAHDTECRTLVDEKLQYGSLFSEYRTDTLRIGYGFPGSEGEYTYRGDTYPGGQIHRWRRRYHPFQEGLSHEYSLCFNMDGSSGFREFYVAEWLNAFSQLSPEVNHHDIEQVRDIMLSILPGLAVRGLRKTGLSNWYDATDPSDTLIDNKAIFGFTGKNIEIAYWLLYEARLHPDEENSDYQKLACEIISSFTDLRVSPPEGEGYYFSTGRPALAIPSHGQIYLRSYGDCMKALASAYLLEREYGTDHPEWISWMTDFGTWLLIQQYQEGGFPRAWKPGTGDISSASPASTYNMIPFLCAMYNITSKVKWLKSAMKAGEFSWESGQENGRFIGGTIDNPDVLDKEAGSLSAEAYLSLYEATEDRKWLDRAEVAAQFSETWIYIWNVPMVTGDSESEWADNVSTIGLQLISTGHSLVDNYMAFDVDIYAKLYKYTANKHYFKVAKILLHNTKGMLALPGREYQYRAPGWIQEHWSLAPPRGQGLHPGWLPWVTTSNLNGICETEKFNREIFEELKKEE